MADVQIWDLTPDAAPAGTRLIETQADADGGQNTKSTIAQLITQNVPLGDYLPLAGGKMTGPLVIDDATQIEFVDATDTLQGRIWYGTASNGQGFHFTNENAFQGFNLLDSGVVEVGSALGLARIQGVPNTEVAATSSGGVVILNPDSHTDVSSKLLKNGLDPVDAQDLATKNYVDTQVGAVPVGDVVGPASAVDSNIAAFDTTTGKLIKDSGVAVSLVSSAVQPGDNVSDLTNDLGYITAVIDDTSPVLGGDLAINGNSIGDQETAASGNSFSAGEVGYPNASGEIVKASAASEAAGGNKNLVMALESVAATTSGAFAHLGQVKGLAGGTAGEPVYLSTTAGAVTTTPPVGSGEIVRLVGYWRSASVFQFEPSTDWIELV